MAPGARVLFESPDGAEAQAVWSVLARQGYETMWCPGPPADHPEACALVRTGSCSLVDEAEVVVSALDQASCGEVARRLDAAAGDDHPTPVVVVASRYATLEFSAALPHSEVISGPLSTKELLRSVTRATRAPTAPSLCCNRPATAS